MPKERTHKVYPGTGVITLTKLGVSMLLFAFMTLGCERASEKSSPNPESAAPSESLQQVEPLDEFLRDRIEAAGVPPQIAVGNELILASAVLPLFYERRAYAPAWCHNGGLQPQADALIEAIRGADQEGLNPSDYHLGKIESLLESVYQQQAEKKPLDSHQLVDLDLLLTDAFFVYGSHLLAGKINPETIDSEWFADRRDLDLAAHLQTALEKNQIEEALRNLLPPQPGYARLRKALARYRDIAANGGWPMVSDGPKLQRDDSGERVLALRRRLIAAGDLDPAAGDSLDLFDGAVEEALRKFQQRHGLDVDGVVGAATLANLNVPVKERIRQVILNMERWRWLPQDLGQRHILVNIANFELDVFESGQIVLMMRVMVGRDYRRTPVFSDTMTYLVLSPYWHVPPGIAVRDILPAVKKDPGYLAKQNMKVFQGWGAEAKAIDPTTIDWHKITARNFNYRFRQDPGPINALGRVKFMFPNRFNVYLHDTPSRELFTRTERAFSSGCIRVEKPIELAEYVLRGDPKWTRASIEAAIKTWREQTVRLPEPIPIHLLYWTAWANDDGSINFRRDIYGRDKRLEEALLKKPPST